MRTRLAILAVFAAGAVGATLSDVVIPLSLSILPYPWMIVLTAAGLLSAYFFVIKYPTAAPLLTVITGALIVGLFVFHASSAVELFRGNWYLTRNHAPTFSAKAKPGTVPKRGRTRIEVTASDQDGDTLVFLYAVPQRTDTVGGSVKPSSWTDRSEAIFEAPDNVGRAMVQVTVRDEGRQKSLDTSREVWIAVVTDEPTSNALNSGLDAARAALERGDYAEAANRFSDLEDRLGDLPPISLGRGVSLASTGAWAVALNDYDRLVMNQPSDLAYLLRAQAYLKQGNSHRADQDVSQALLLATDPSRQRLLRAYVGASNTTQKEELLKKVIILTPTPIPLTGVTTEVRPGY